MHTGRRRRPIPENLKPEILNIPQGVIEAKVTSTLPENPETEDVMKWLGLSRAGVLRLVGTGDLHIQGDIHHRPFVFNRAEVEALRVARMKKKGIRAKLDEERAARRYARLTRALKEKKEIDAKRKSKEGKG